MDDFYSSIWLHHESLDEMRQNLQNTLFELETLKMEANEKSRTHTEEVNQLLTLLKSTQQERDQARQQLSQFLTQTQNSNSRSITESNSLSRDGSSSPSSSELSSFLNIHPPQPSMILNDAMAHKHHQLEPMDALVMGKAFPETGKLLKAVVEAGPLLQTLLVAGPLPKWVNPPPQTQSQRFDLPPPFSFKGSDVSNSSLTCSGSVMRFGIGSSSVIDQTMLNGKRQRLE
ncbi:PREDICTED: uncharacterized protein LOC106326266 [Brassica oleracea var. oleracea]|uniref:Uncharacterized protein n=1 Tax=Brassica oleracea var. oleracea TaxID=109376 RepID=A0A0D3AKX0_BRAOL|nr:PREDICTED: uncharacterized protein LOC106326266 [Brassica oleracea var. oleracea]